MTCVLLYIGGGLTVLYSLPGLVLFETIYGAIILVLAWRLHRRRRWAWWALTAVCVLSLLVNGVYLGLYGLRYAPNLTWPVLYLILLTRPTVRDWFFNAPPQPFDPPPHGDNPPPLPEAP